MKVIRLFLALALIAAAQEALTNESIVKLVKAGLGEALIVKMIQSQPGKYSLGTDDMVKLKESGVTDQVLTAMLARSSGAAVVSPAAAPPPDTPAAERNASPETADSFAARPSGPLPGEEGVYWVTRTGELDRIEGVAVSNVRTGSMLASAATIGIKKAKLNAQIKGSRAELRVTVRQPAFYFYLHDGASIGDFVLLRLVQRGDVRQMEVAERSLFKMQSGFDHSKEADFSYKRIKNKLYLLTPKGELASGEYGFYTASGAELTKATGRLYDFGID